MAWCFDILHNLNFSNTTYKYETTTSPFGFNGGFSSDKLSDLGKLFNTAYANLGGLGSGLMNAAFQVAIWEIGFETAGNAYDAGDGDFYATPSSSIVTEANKLSQ